MDWGRVSDDYNRYRSGPPASFYARLKERGVGLPGQRILDFGTGTGLLARAFAKAGARVSGIDSSRSQVDHAVRAAADERLAIDFRVAPAESTPFPAASFDVVTANQCWHFLDGGRATAEARRVLKAGGVLVVSDFFWVAKRDPIAAATEDLILKFCPGWDAYRWDGELPARPDLVPEAVISYEEPIPFTRDVWRGRVRTCRVIGPALSPDVVEAFDRELGAILERIAPERFEVLHKVLAHFYRMA